MKLKLLFSALLFIAAFVPGRGNDSENIMRAMNDELERSMDELRLASVAQPYYIEFNLRQRKVFEMQATFGSLLESTSSEYNSLTVGLRVGGPAFDNSNFFDVSLNFFGSTDDEESYRNRRIPNELTYQSLRRELWLATDAAYKQAAELYTKKEAAVENRVRLDTTADFILMEKVEAIDPAPAPPFDQSYFRDLVTRLSGVFRDFPAIDLSQVNLEYLPETVYYLNTEGRRMVKSELFTGLEITAATQATDGMPIAQSYTCYSLDPAKLPSADSLMRATRELAQTLTKQVEATLIEAYSGPVLFEDQAAAEVFAQIFLPNLATVRAPLQDGGFQERPRFSAFQNKIGGRVLPEFLSIDVSPDRREFEGAELSGTLTYDDEAVAAESFRIVEGGYLKGLLSSRTPTRRVKKSNGHSRGGAAMLSVLELHATPEKTKSNAELRARMMELCEARELPYGLIVRKALNLNLLITSLYQMTEGEYPFTRGEGIVPLLEVYKLYPDGREELIRGVEVNGISHQSFKDILGIGKRRFAYNWLAGAITSPFYTGGRQYLAASFISSDVLFEDLEISPVEADFEKPPLLRHPHFSDMQ